MIQADRAEYEQQVDDDAAAAADDKDDNDADKGKGPIEGGGLPGAMRSVTGPSTAAEADNAAADSDEEGFRQPRDYNLLRCCCIPCSVCANVTKQIVPRWRPQPKWNLKYAAAVAMLSTSASDFYRWKDARRQVFRIRLITDTRIPVFWCKCPLWCMGCQVSCRIKPVRRVRGTDREAITGRGGAEWVIARGLKLPHEVDGRLPDGRYLLYFHGGAYNLCNPGTHRDVVGRYVCRMEGRALVVDYRRPPEHPFPAAEEDCLAAYRWLSSRVDPSRIMLGGDSAGGALVACVLGRIVAEEGLANPAAGIMVSPWVDLADPMTSESWQGNVCDFIPPDVIKGFADLYVGDTSADEVSATHRDFEGIAPVLIQTGGAERLHDQQMAFADKVKAAGVDVTVHVGEGMVHAYPMLSFTKQKQCVEAYDQFEAMVDKYLPADNPLPPV